MARSRLTDTTQDLIADGGSVLWSFIKGEQLEFPITLNFIEDATLKATGNYIYEAVVVEAANIPGQIVRPTTVQPNGVATTLFIRIPSYEGTWTEGAVYPKESVVLYNSKYYRALKSNMLNNNQIDITTPALSSNWLETTLNKIYVQFPKTLASTWAVQPQVENPSYGFFELRVTEPEGTGFIRTFKPVRGMVEILFSPTDEVTDTTSQTQPT